MSINSVMPSNHLILCRPLVFSPSIFPSIRVFSNEWALHIRWPKYWSFSFSTSPSKEYSGLISFRMDCSMLILLHVLAVTLWYLQSHSLWYLLWPTTKGKSGHENKSLRSWLQCFAWSLDTVSPPFSRQPHLDTQGGSCHQPHQWPVPFSILIFHPWYAEV